MLSLFSVPAHTGKERRDKNEGVALRSKYGYVETFQSMFKNKENLAKEHSLDSRGNTEPRWLSNVNIAHMYILS